MACPTEAVAMRCPTYPPHLLPNFPLAVPQQIDLGRNLDTQRSFVQEALSLQRLRHPHVVAFFGVRQAAQLGLWLQTPQGFGLWLQAPQGWAVCVLQGGKLSCCVVLR